MLRRLYSTFAGGWPGIGLLLMRLVVGAVLLWHVGPRLWSNPSLHLTAVYASLALAALLLMAGLWTPVAGAVVAVVAISESSRRANPPLGAFCRHHRRRADDARTRPVVDRRPALRLEAHRDAVRKSSSTRGLARNATPERVPARHPPVSPPGEWSTPTESSPAHPSQSSPQRLMSRRTRPNGGCGSRCDRRQSPKQGGQ